jgi:hypothetical protein
MPGKRQRERNAKKLTQRQAKIAEDVLLPRLNPSLGEWQWDSGAKEQLVQAVNDAFAAKGFETIYSQRKLEDWVSNTMYRWRMAAQQSEMPPSWKGRVMNESVARPDVWPSGVHLQYIV